MPVILLFQSLVAFHQNSIGGGVGIKLLILMVQPLNFQHDYKSYLINVVPRVVLIYCMSAKFNRRTAVKLVYPSQFLMGFDSDI